MSLIEIQNVKKEFKQGEIIVPALRGINLSVNEGEFSAIVGPSGSGKTTLLNCIGALDTVTSGEIIIDKKKLSGLNNEQLTDFRLNELGFIFQAYNLIPVFTAAENVEYVLTLKGMEKKERRERSKNLFREMDMVNLLNRFPRELSGGQQQRVAVARALISEPKLILADEPTANLDSENAEKLLDIMLKMANEKQSTFLFSTHDERVMRRAKRIINLHDGFIYEKEAA